MHRNPLLVALLAFLIGLSSASAQVPLRSARIRIAAPSAPAWAVPATSGCFTAALSGAYEIPPNNSTAVGTGMFILSPNRMKLIYRIEHAVAGETAAHIHKGAAGTSGPPINGGTLPSGAVKEGIIDLDAQSATDLLAGLLYVNIHSSAFSNGEIRGQIMPSGGCFSTTLSGANETPPVITTASGSAILALWPDQSKLLYHVEYVNLGGSEAGAHIHRGEVGQPGPIIITLGTLPNGLSNAKDGTAILTAQTLSDLQNGLLYINIHSTAHGTGEIRGQIMPAAACFTAVLSSLNEVANPPISSPATGIGRFILWPGQLQLSYRIEHTVTGESAAHIHKGAPGVSGPPIAGGTLPLGALKEGMAALTAQDINDLFAGLLYVNIHSATHSSGEIRGQLVPGNCQLSLPLVERPEA